MISSHWKGRLERFAFAVLTVGLLIACEPLQPSVPPTEISTTVEPTQIIATSTASASTLTPDIAAEVKKQPIGLELESLKLIADDLVGAVRNNSGRSIYGIEIAAQFVDSQTNRIVHSTSTRFSQVSVLELWPEQLVPFSLSAPDVGNDWDRVELDIKEVEYGELFAPQQLDTVAISELAIVPFERQLINRAQVTGVMINTSDRTLGSTDFLEGFQVLVIGFDQNDEVIAFGLDSLSVRLEPGQSVDFSIFFILGDLSQVDDLRGRAFLRPEWD